MSEQNKKPEEKKKKLKIDPKSFRYLTNVEASQAGGGAPPVYVTEGTTPRCSGSGC